MSRTPALYSMQVTRGSTWEDEFVYTDANGDEIDLTGYEARMQVRTMAGRYGETTTSTLLLDIGTTGMDPSMLWDTAADGRLLIKCPPDVHTTLNPTNVRRIAYSYSIEIYLPAGADPEYVIPLVKGLIYSYGETTR